MKVLPTLTPEQEQDPEYKQFFEELVHFKEYDSFFFF